MSPALFHGLPCHISSSLDLLQPTNVCRHFITPSKKLTKSISKQSVTQHLQKDLKRIFYLCIPERSQDERLKVKLTLKQGQLTVLQGPSGSGKSSILRVLAGFDRFASGMVESPSQKLWITQQPYLFKETLKANLTYPELPDKVSDSKALALLEKVGLGRLEPFLNHTVDWQHRLSGGEQQRLMLARMLLLKPQVLLLDEATSALDETTAEAMTEMLRLELKKFSNFAGDSSICSR